MNTEQVTKGTFIVSKKATLDDMHTMHCIVSYIFVTINVNRLVTLKGPKNLRLQEGTFYALFIQPKRYRKGSV